MPLTLKRIWHFIWKEDSLLSWIVNIILAFLIVKFLIYPGLGLILGTNLPVVAVVSSSMEHNANFDNWWENNKNFYLKKDILKQDFQEFSFKNGFDRGDIIVLRGKDFKDIEIGEVIVYDNSRFSYPIIHRVIEKNEAFITKGDNNAIPDPNNVDREKVRGVGIFKIPLLGWIKIWFVDIINTVRG